MPRMRESEAQNIVHNAGWFASAWQRERWPLLTADAAALLREGGGFDVDAERLEDLVERGIVRGPVEPGCWGAADVCLAAEVLGDRWQYLDPEDPRLPYLAQCATPERVARRAGQHDARAVLLALVHCDRLETRQGMAAMLLRKLEADHGVRI
ncbi:MAG TPA: hypothetical protein VKE40_17320 [Gemmataceae bacterium]|nr:hypothetical protein [Gemmataceae bacterium]